MSAKFKQELADWIRQTRNDAPWPGRPADPATAEGAEAVESSLIPDENSVYLARGSRIVRNLRMRDQPRAESMLLTA